MEMVFGWNTPLTTKVTDYNSTAGMLSGDAIYLDSYITPVLTVMAPSLNTYNVTILTGEKEGDMPGQVYEMNGLGYPNKKFWVWNGAEIVETAVRCYGDFKSYQVFDGTLNKNESAYENAFVLDTYSL